MDWAMLWKNPWRIRERWIFGNADAASLVEGKRYSSKADGQSFRRPRMRSSARLWPCSRSSVRWVTFRSPVCCGRMASASAARFRLLRRFDRHSDIIIYAKYYGVRAAAWITWIFYISMVLAGIIVLIIFSLSELIPPGARPPSAIEHAHII